MPRLADLLTLSSSRTADPASAGIDRFVGLEHIEPENLHIRSWGNVADGTTFTNTFKRGQVLFGKRRAYQRKVAVADFDGVCSGDIYVFESKDPNVLLPELVPFILQSEGFYEYAVKTSAGSLSPRTNWTHLANYELNLPPVDEQRRIADLLWAADDDICKTQDLYLATQTLKKVVLNNLLTSGSLENRQIVFPESWEMLTIGHLGNIVTGTTPSTTNKEYYGDEFMFVSPADISDEMFVFETEKHLSKSGLDVSRKLPKDSVMVVCIGSTIGKVAITTSECSTNQQINSIVCNEDNEPKFIYYLMKSLERTIKSFAGATAVPILNKQDFSKIQIKVPPFEEQIKIVSIMDEFERVIIASKTKLENAQKLKKQLLTSQLG